MHHNLPMQSEIADLDSRMAMMFITIASTQKESKTWTGPKNESHEKSLTLLCVFISIHARALKR